ncbi:hypothetical protein SynROS8604_01199 [Synechococcus sp. ROS8604]|nr:hypothetical protein SynROS8604_01199 [Synechococcus sp. ROS8604]
MPLLTASARVQAALVDSDCVSLEAWTTSLNRWFAVLAVL